MKRDPDEDPLELVRRALAGLKFGEVVIAVHADEIVQIARTEKIDLPDHVDRPRDTERPFSPRDASGPASIVMRSLLVIVLLAAPAFAQPSDPPPAPEPPPVAEPEPAPPPPAPPAIGEIKPEPKPDAKPKKSDAPVTITAATGKGVTFKSEPFSLNLRARAQARYQLHAPPADKATNRQLDEVTQINTVRLWFSGHTLSPKVVYMIQLALGDRDFRDDAVSPIFDAYIDYKAHRDFNLRVGQYFVPFDRLRTVREFALQMADRPRPVLELTLDRDVGVIAYSDNFLAADSPLAWRAGVFGGHGTNRSVPSEIGSMVIGRLELRPLGPIDDDVEGDLARRARPGLALGVGGAINVNSHRVRSTSGATFASGETTTFYHLAADAVFKWRGLAVQLEYLWRGASKDHLEAEVEGLVVTDDTRQGSGWVVQASYTFDPPFELVGRLARLYAADTTDARYRTEVERLGQEYAAGASYYFNGHQLKLQTDYIVRSGTGANHTRDRDHVFHLQLDVTF